MSATIESYRIFAEQDTAGYSPLYEDWALGVADSAEVVALIDALPAYKRQPNLIFASARKAGVPLSPWSQVHDEFVSRWDTIAGIVLTHATQTNEAGRCALYLPYLSAIEGPIALIEVGAAAGLCLLPDRYSYEYATAGGTVRLDPDDSESPVVLRCELEGVAAPSHLPNIVWRRGVDLNPLDITDPETREWLELLVWPGHEHRRATLAAAATVASAHPVDIHQGDLLDNLPLLIAQAPKDATVVVIHSAVITYLTVEQRNQFYDVMMNLDVVWLSNEGETVLPAVAEALGERGGIGGDFVLARNGVPVARTQPHGAYVRALG